MWLKITDFFEDAFSWNFILEIFSHEQKYSSNTFLVLFEDYKWSYNREILVTEQMERKSLLNGPAEKAEIYKVIRETKWSLQLNGCPLLLMRLHQLEMALLAPDDSLLHLWLIKNYCKMGHRNFFATSCSEKVNEFHNLLSLQRLQKRWKLIRIKLLIASEDFWSGFLLLWGSDRKWMWDQIRWPAARQHLKLLVV